MKNLVENGVLNNVESFLNKLKTCTNVSEAKSVTQSMIGALAIKEGRKLILLRDLNTKRDLTSVLMFAYNINLKGEGLGV